MKIPNQRGHISKLVCASIRTPIKSVSFQTQLAALSVTSWSMSHLARELSPRLWWPVFRAPWLAAGSCCVREMRQAAMAALRSQPKPPTEKECLQPGLGFGARMSVQKHTVWPPECLRELLTHGAYTSLTHFEQYLGPANSTRIILPFLHLVLLTFWARQSFITGLSCALWGIWQHPWPGRTQWQRHTSSPIVMTKNIFRHCQMHPGGQNRPHLTTTALCHLDKAGVWQGEVESGDVNSGSR